MKTSRQFSRRSFLKRSTQAAAAVSVAGSSLLAVEATTSSFKIEAEQVRAMAAGADGGVLVAADDRVLCFGQDGRLNRTIHAPQPVRALSVSRQGRVFVAYKDSLAKLNDAGRLEGIGQAFGNRASAITGLAVSDRGDLFAADSGQRLIWRLDGAGKVLGQIRPADGHFTVPRAFFPIAWQGGQLWVADPGRHQIQAYSAEGQLLSKWGVHSRDHDGFGGCCNPVSLAVHRNGGIVTAERGQPRIKLFSGEGRMQKMLAGPDQFAASSQAARAEADDVFGCQGGLLDVVVTTGGKVLVLDRTAREVRTVA
jgi:hypothetical protein